MQLNVKPYQFNNLMLVLWIIILGFFILSLLFFVLTLIKKTKRIRKDKIKKQYKEKINHLLFPFMFESQDIKTTIKQFDKHYSRKGNLFARRTIKSLIELHRIYKGVYQKKIEHFFVESRLSEHSKKLLQSRNWIYKVESIRNLSELAYSESFQEIKAQLLSKNEMVQEEAILGMIRLRGLDVLLEIKDINLLLSDWFQAHIIHIIKINNFKQPNNFSTLLESKNPTIQLLVARIAQHFQKTEIIEELNCIVSKSANLKIKSQISVIVENLKSIKI
ncbi:MAG: hypothetical protein KGZ59_11955 [Chitinophagaceae bacterium]|nr:hypothetical protein [Chitinophagaceae bacterium]